MIQKIKSLWREFVKAWVVDDSPEEKQRKADEREKRQKRLAEYHKEIKRISDDIEDAIYLHQLQIIKLNIESLRNRFSQYCFEGFDEMLELLEKDRSDKIDEIQNLSSV